MMRMMMITMTLMVFYDVRISGSIFINGIVHVFCIRKMNCHEILPDMCHNRVYLCLTPRTFLRKLKTVKKYNHRE